MTSAADLFALQELDLRRDARRAVIADVDTRLGETEELISARAEVEQAEAKLAGLRREQRDVEVQLEDLDAKIGPIETKLYGGSIRNPKELTDLQKEVDLLKGRRGKLDDAGLTSMERVEVAHDLLVMAQKRLSSVTAEWQADQEELRRTRARAEQEAQELDADRGRRTATMDAAPLALYERLRSLKQGRALARAERNSCGGCRISLPTHVMQRVRAGGELVQCPSCERILVAG